MQKLSKIKDVLEEGESPLLRQLFGILFPFGPGWNSGGRYVPHAARSPSCLIIPYMLRAIVLGTFYISSCAFLVCGPSHRVRS